MNIYEYNSSSINVFSTDDNGSIASVFDSTVNNGSITDVTYGPDYIVSSGDLIVPLDSDFIIGSQPSFDYGYVFNTETAYPYGSIKFNSTTNSARSVIFIAAVEPIKLSSIERNSTRKVWVGSGTLFEIGGGQELTAFSWLASSGPLRVSGSAGSKAIYSYNISSIEGIPGSINYGTISGVHGSSENYGSVADISGGNSLDYGYIINETSKYPFGTFSTLGAASVSSVKSTYIGSGSLFAVSGSSNSFARVVREKSEGINISGSAKVVSRTSFNGSGSILNTGFDIEKVSYDYNESSISLFDSINFGNITASGFTLNYGSINIGASQFFNYGFIYDTTTNIPFGTLILSGGSKEIFKPTFAQISTGGFNISGTSKTQFKPLWVSFGDIRFTGDTKYSQTKPYIASGSFSKIGSKDEKVTFNYNASSVNLYSQINYGSITASGVFINYGSIQNTAVPEFNYGYIYDTGIVYPYGTLNLSGSSASNTSKGTYRGSGSLFAIGSAAEVEVDVKTEPTGLFTISGESTSKFSSRYIGSGSFSNIGSITEKATFSYNTSSVNLYSEINYGFITASGVSVNYGSITTGASQFYDYDGIWYTDNEYPFGTLTLSGAVSEVYKPTFAQTSTGGFTVSGTAKTQFKPIWESFGNIILTGDAKYSQIRPYIASGFISNVGSKDEKATFSYNSSSIETFATTNYGFITASGVFINYGSIQNTPIQGLDYGDIWITQVTYPYGTLNLSGSSSINSSKGTYKGTGSLFAIGSAAEVEVDVKTESNVLFVISGESSVKSTFKHDGSGSLSNIGSKTEKATFSYNSSSIATYGTTNYGFITASGVFINYGSIQNTPVQVLDYGDIWITQTLYPYGTLNLSGSSVFNSSKGTYRGSGSLFAIGSAAEVEVDIKTEPTGLFTISGESRSKFISSYNASGSFNKIGSKTEKATFSYNSSSIATYATSDYGFITASGVSVNYGSIQNNAVQEIDYGYVYQTGILYPYGSITINGTAQVSADILFVHIGSGSLFTIGGTSSGIPFRNIISNDAITISGSASVRFSTGYTGSGSLNKIGSKIERATYSYNRSSIDLFNRVDLGFINQSGTNENYGSILDPLDTSVLNYGVITNLRDAYPFGSLNITGAVKYDETRYIPKITGTGSLFAIGGDVNAYSRIAVTEKQTFVVSGNSTEAKSKTFIGTGSLFTIGGLTISATANPKEENQLFRISGEAIEKHTESYVGTGSVYLQTGIYPEYLYYRPTPRYVNSIYGEIGGSAFVNGDAGTRYFAVYTHIASGSAYINGNSFPKFLPIYYGSGNIFISGTAAEKEVDIFTGSGSLFGISGASESRTTNPPEETQLFRISGAASERQTDAHAAFITANIGGESRILKTSAFAGDIEIAVDGSKIEKRSITQVGSGSFSIIKGAAEVYSVNPPEENQLFRISGAASTRYISVYTHISSGSEFVSGNCKESETNKFEGSGSLFAINGAAQEFTATPVTEKVLFRISGSGLDKFTRQFISSGSEFIFGSAKESQSEAFIGSGSIFTSGNVIATRSRTGESSGRLVLSGNVYNVSQKTFIGSGSLFAINGSAESKVTSIKTTDAVLSISGNATIRVAVANTTSGSQYIYGSSLESNTETFKGSGSLFEFGSSANALKYAVVADTALFRISGEARNVAAYKDTTSGSFTIAGIAKAISAKSYSGTGSEFVSGNTIEKETASYIGTGSLFGFGGSAQASTSNPREERANIRISGEATNIQRTKSELGSGSYTYQGNCGQRKTNKFFGSGSLFTINSSTSSTSIKIKEQESSELFKIDGESNNSYTRISQFESGKFTISGNSIDESVLFTPPRVFGTII